MLNVARPELSVLFRYRDLVAETVEAHEEVIRGHGACWWGWWKRPSEHARLDIWDELAERASERTPVRVGLFDSGNGSVRTAVITAIVKPRDDASERLNVPENESELVPGYYRASPFSRAWMKITSFGPSIADFFGNYSFAAPPDLQNFSLSDTQRFVHKVILGPEELRTMDTTIWRIRPRREGDSTERILLSSTSLAEPVSASPIACSSNIILHLTDPHYAVGADRDKHVWRLENQNDGRLSLSDAVSMAIPRGMKVGAVIVTGDLTFKGTPEEFEQARAGLTKLLGNLNLDFDHLIVIPGNHDIRWATDASYHDDAPVELAPEAAKANYAQFYRELLHHAANDELSMARKFILPSGIVVEIAALNSSSLTTGRNFLAGMGKIQEDAFMRIAHVLGWTSQGRSSALRMLCLHHHVALTENFERPEEYYRGFGLAIDAVRIQRLAAKHGIRLVLHGHKHRAFVWRSQVYELPAAQHKMHALGSISIIGGGTAGSVESENNERFFSLINVEPDHLTTNLYRSANNGIFEDLTWIKAPLQSPPGSNGLTLGEWAYRD